MKLLILFIALAAAFYPRLDGSMSGSDFFLGGEDIIGLSGGAKNFGLVVATRTDWSFDGTSTVTADTTAYYVAPSTAGSSKASTTVYLNNNTFVTTNDKDGSVVSGFFKQNKFTGEMDMIGTGKGQNSAQLVISAKWTPESISEVVTVTVGGQVMNVYPKLHAVSEEVFNTIAGHGGSSSSNPTTVPAMYKRNSNMATSIFAAFPLKH